MIRKTISFTQAHSDWMKAQVASGQYASESELIRDLIRTRQEGRGDGFDGSPEHFKALRKIIDDAEASGLSNQTPREIYEEVRAELLSDAKL